MKVILPGLLTLCFACCFAASPPNVLIIVLDDENGYAGRRDIAPQPVTPNLDKLGHRGITFTAAQCAAPVCNPSRTAVFSGLRPSTSGIYSDDQDRTPSDHILTRTVSLPNYFHDHGYLTAGSGKLFGSSFGSLLKHHVWDETKEYAGKGRLEDARPPKDQLPLSGLKGKHDFGPFPANRDGMGDWQLALWAAEFLTKPQSKPFFLACGIVKPHTPWYVPKEYFDMFPPDKIHVPDLAEDEAAGLPDVVRVKPKQIKQAQELVARRKEMIAAYLACSRYADDCVGHILDALEHSAFRDNTLVVVFGDNGYQFGEKHYWSKGRLWEGSAHVPLIMAGPGVEKGMTCTKPVSLVDLYPTLIELAQLPSKDTLDGQSMVPLLKNPNASWDRPALTTASFKNHALRSERWRYIKYADGSEELYDHQTDPLEQKNIASDPTNAKVITEMQKWLPIKDAPKYPNGDGKESDQ